MKPARTALAALAAAGVALAPLAAQAAPERAPSTVGEHEQFVGNWVIGALLIAALIPLAILLSSDSENEPASP